MICFKKGNRISFNIIDSRLNGDYNVDAVVDIIKSYDLFDLRIRYNINVIISNGKINFEIPELLEAGLYRLEKIEMCNQSINFVYNQEIEFVVGYKISKEKSVYQKIRSIRDKNFYREKNLINKNCDKFHIYIFCKNLLVQNFGCYNDISVMPYKYLKRTNELDYMDDYFENVRGLYFRGYDKTKFEKDTPTCVFSIFNIYAKNGDEARKYALDRAETIKNIYCALLHSHGEFSSVMIWNDTKKEYSYQLLESRYKGNLFLLADQGYNVNHYYNSLESDNSYLKLYFRLLNDAVIENNRMMKYYRYWNILEGLSFNKNYCNKEMKKWNGQNVVNKKGENVKIGTEALNNVFELLRENFSNISEEQFVSSINGITKVKEFLSICYQRRCCCAHYGDCIMNNFSCNDKESEIRCKNNNVIKDDAPIDYQDEILTKLAYIVPDILLKELNSIYGEPKLEDSMILNLLKESEMP